MLDVIFVLFFNAVFFLGIVAAAALVCLPFVKLFRRREKIEELKYAKDCAGC